MKQIIKKMVYLSIIKKWFCRLDTYFNRFTIVNIPQNKHNTSAFFFSCA